MEVSHLQFLFMGTIFTINTAVGLAPVLLKGNLPERLVPKPHVKSRLLSCASCVGAGVFLFVCFIGLLPEADKKFHHFLEELGHTNEEWESFAEFPWAYFVVTLGFLVIFVTDKMVHALEHAHENHEDANGFALLPQLSENGVKKNGFNVNECNADDGMVSNSHCHGYDECLYKEDGHGAPSSVIFLIALGIHSVFEGMAVGLQTQKEKIMELAVAVIVHEVVMALTFGLEVSKSNVLTKWKKISYIIIFAATIPIGVFVGYALHNAPSDHREIVSAVFEAFATGIFIHIIFIEVLAHEFPGHRHYHLHHHHDKKTGTPTICEPTETRSQTLVILEKVGCICFGLLTLILMSIFMHDHHHH